jgi:hypothetical protein
LLSSPINKLKVETWNYIRAQFSSNEALTAGHHFQAG